MSGDSLIGVFKLVKAGILLLASGGEISLLDKKIAERARQFVSQISGDTHFRIVRKVASYLGIPPRKRIEFMSLACLFYSVMFSIQGVGLLYAKRWAEYLTVIITASFVPVETYDCIRKPELFKYIILMVNLAVTIYLGIQLCVV